MRKLGARHTVAACYGGYVTQAIVNNFAPLLFLTFQREYGISLTLIGTMITVNFGIQLFIDCVSSRFVDKIGYRPCLVAAHVLAGAGLILLAVLPDVLPSPIAGLFAASAVYAVGGGLIEVLVSPAVEACPTKNKRAAMSLLHSFYCWGQVCVVALSALFFALAGIENWRILACIWAALPLLNAVAFLFVPFFPLVEEGKTLRLGQLLRNRAFWLCAVLVLCAGGAELAVSQWASAFAEAGLGVSKTVGDLLGPCMFAVCMGTSRVLFSLFGGRMRTETALAVKDGATEIDIVMPVGKFLSGDYEGVCDDINELKQACGDAPMKVILETGCLKTASNIKKASILAMYAGADYIKTSTGKLEPAATPEAAYVMCQAIKEYYDETGIQIGFKPAGGLNSVMDALIYYTIVKEVLGEKWLTNKWLRLGTSRLANMLLSEILGEETKFF